ncbi:hypothetical protein KIPB_011606, partial [Kipferlia bialata]|eukprot:g11606.t1
MRLHLLVLCLLMAWAACANTVTRHYLTDASGTFGRTQSEYNNLETHHFLLQVPDLASLALVCSCDTESGYDFVYVHEATCDRTGTGFTKGTELGKYSGETTIKHGLSFATVSQSDPYNCLYVKFTSDQLVSGTDTEFDGVHYDLDGFTCQYWPLSMQVLTQPFTSTCQSAAITFTLTDTHLGAVVLDDLSSYVKLTWDGAALASTSVSFNSGTGVYSVSCTAPTSTGTYALTVSVVGLELYSGSATLSTTSVAGGLSLPSHAYPNTPFSVSVVPRDGCTSAFVTGLSVSAVVLDSSDAEVSTTTMPASGETYTCSPSIAEEGVYTIRVVVDGNTLEGQMYVSSLVHTHGGTDYYISPSLSAASLVVPSEVALGGTFTPTWSVVDVTGAEVAVDMGVSVSWDGTSHPDADITWDSLDSEYSLSLSAPSAFGDAGSYTLSIYLDGVANSIIEADIGVGLQAGSTYVYDVGPLVFTGTETSPYGTCHSLGYTFTLLDLDGSV